LRGGGRVNRTTGGGIDAAGVCERLNIKTFQCDIIYKIFIKYKLIGAAPGGIFLLGGEGAFGQKSL
jgi:hypothetical protein